VYIELTGDSKEMKKALLRESIRIKIHDLRIGMFITELDKPWTQTPFMLQGFILLEQKDFETLQLLVKELYIDPRRSDPSSFLHIPWGALHEETEVEEEDITLPVIIIENDSEDETATNKKLGLWNVISNFFIKNKTSAQGKNNQSNKSKNKVKNKRNANKKLPHFLKYTIDKSHNTLTRETIVRKRQNLKKPLPPSTPQFTAFIQKLYPRDTAFLSLSWREKWNIWREKTSDTSHLGRAQLISIQKPKKKKPDYIPENIPLVTYGEHVTLKFEINNTRELLEKADSLIKKINLEFEETGVLDLEQIAPTVQLLSESVIANPAALMWLVRMREENKAIVSQALKVAVYMMTLGRHIGFNKTQLIELGFIGLLLDIGKLEVPSEILQKAEKLTVEERSIIQRHVQSSMKLLRAAEAMSKNIELGISEHHEMINGSGYPQGLKGEQISIFGRMAAIADSFAAMTSPRSYSITLSSFDAMKELFRYTETQFHAPLVEEFVQAIGIFPVGSMIELSSGVIAIVLEHNKVRRLEPKVLILTKSDKKLLEKPQVLDLMKQNLFIENKRISIVRGLPDGAYGLVFQDFYKAA
jgi:HD-GYP domain-containing protein (c-di-GMP phosphodiesterase class II)